MIKRLQICERLLKQECNRVLFLLKSPKYTHYVSLKQLYAHFESITFFSHSKIEDISIF